MPWHFALNILVLRSLALILNQLANLNQKKSKTEKQNIRLDVVFVPDTIIAKNLDLPGLEKKRFFFILQNFGSGICNESQRTIENQGYITEVKICTDH